MSRDKRSPLSQASAHPVKIRWAAALPPVLLGRLYEADARGLRDEELCDDVGMRLFARCEAFHRALRHEVQCPLCGVTFVVAGEGRTACPGSACAWYTDHSTFSQSLRRYYLYPGRAVQAFSDFYRDYPSAKSYGEKMVLIDQLIHSFHLDEKTRRPVKSVASKLLEGNKKEVVRFLDALSSKDGAAKDAWRRIVATTIDAKMVGRGK